MHHFCDTTLMQPVYLICGVPASGKSWVCRQLKDKFNYVPHDRCWEHPTLKPKPGDEDGEWPPGAKSTHLQVLSREVHGNKPIVTECPFGERILKDALDAQGIEVKAYFVVEKPQVVIDRYRQRQKRTPPQNVITRATTIEQRADEWAAPKGTSEEVLNLLIGLEL